MCGTLKPAEVIAKNGGVFVSRTCEKHGLIEGLACSDIAWYENLSTFAVPSAKPASRKKTPENGCPQDCGLCSSHCQSAGTVAVEISNACNLQCSVCLADNKETFSLGAASVKKIADALIARQGSVETFTLSGGEPTLHPQIFDIITVLERPEIHRIVLNTNGVRIAEDEWFLNELQKHPNVYVCLHFDGPSARKIRGVEPAMQQKALDRLIRWKINVVPIMLGIKDVTEPDLGPTISRLLTCSTSVKSVILSLMAHSGPRGLAFPGSPTERLTIPRALERMESTSRGRLRKCDFMPLPMSNPLCAAIGYFMVMDNEITPLIPLVPLGRLIDFTKNAHFAKASEELEHLLKDLINDLCESPDRFFESAKLLGKFRTLLLELFPDGSHISDEERRHRAEERIKTISIIQFMDAWTFDSVRLSQCSCQHLLPDGNVIPSCGYYAYHRSADQRFAV